MTAGISLLQLMLFAAFHVAKIEEISLHKRTDMWLDNPFLWKEIPLDTPFDTQHVDFFQANPRGIISGYSFLCIV